MHKRISLSVEEDVIKIVHRFMKGKHLNFSQAVEVLIRKNKKG